MDGPVAWIGLGLIAFAWAMRISALDKLLADRGMTLTQLFERVGVSVVNLSILKNGHATDFATVR